MTNLTRKCFLIFSLLMCCCCCSLSCLTTSWTVYGALIAVLFACMSGTCMDILLKAPARSHTLKTLLLQYFITRLLILRGSWVYRRFLRNSLLIDCGQEKFLLKFIVKKNMDTEFGRKHNFQEMRTKEDFARKVPLSTYDDYCSYIHELLHGHPNVVNQKIMTHDPVVYLATSSGTTGKNKNLPLTSFTKKTASLNISPHLVYMSSKLGGFHLGRVLVISYCAEKILCKSGLYKGPVSSHIGKYLPYLLVPREVYNIQNEALVLHLISVFALSEKEICQIEALFSTLVYSFFRHIDHYWPMICRIIESGKLEFDEEILNKNSNNLDLSIQAKTSTKRYKNIQQLATESVLNSNQVDVNLLKYLESRLTPNPARANELRKIFENGFENLARQIWPSIKFVRMINTGGFATYAASLKKVHMKDVKQLSLLHAASEGFFGLNAAENDDWQDRVCYTFQPEYGFFEFIREADVNINPQDQTTIFIEELKVGEKYEIVYTSQNGLYRYKTGDVVKITGFINHCPSYTFEYRTGQVLNLFWEKTPEYVLNKAVEVCMERMTDVQLVDFVATEDLHMPDFYRKKYLKKHYVLLLEVYDANKGDVVLDEDQLKMFDRELMNLFELYATLRKNGSIGEMKAIQVEKNSLAVLRRATLVNPQRKLPRVLRDAKQISDLLQCALNASYIINDTQ
ncbi:hypothetical protein HELRODRAFT_192162 [Helobdella robusta]|uniref:GH3 domain-containing protein n=1 Tax=Helobdella robusta TaxID=6412 RepID=T1FTN1_HELRO|nr:hypothetical protein HELRODRAFT_192162 [Helobdella robusta]ESO02931.1 hypothetical protein HELRODRAFT_192162 [Helobdella robusta]